MKDAFDSDREYIRISRRLHHNGQSLHDNYIRRYSLADFEFFNPRSGQPLLTKAVYFPLSKFRRRPFDRFPLYHGSCWWSLTAASIDALLDIVNNDHAVLKLFSYCYVPGEIFFHSLLKRCRTSKNIVDDLTIAVANSARPNLHGMHYIDWTNANPDLPRVLDLDDLDKIRQSDAFFMRIVNSDRSGALISEINRRREVYND